MAMPSILIIDDQPDLTRPLFDSLGKRAIVEHPMSLTLEQLRHARVALIDHHLTPNDWPERGGFPVACQPEDGVALAGIVLGHLRKLQADEGHFPPTAVALLSNELHRVTPGFDDPPEYLAARTAGVHWAFSKKTGAQNDLCGRLLELENAVESLPKKWPVDNSDELFVGIEKLLGLNSTLEWSGLAMTHALRCHPPIHELAGWTSGLAFLRWLAHTILPYPTFLIDAAGLAIRLGVQPHWLLPHMATGGSLAKVFAPAAYAGVLNNFIRARWWLAGTDSILWNISPELAQSQSAIIDWLSKTTNSTPPPVPPSAARVFLASHRLSDAIAPIEDCVRLEPDDWPVFADPVYTTIVNAKASPRLSALVAATDRERIQ